jgi:hypothetical protein
MRSQRGRQASGARARGRIVRALLSSTALAGVIAAAALPAGPAYAGNFDVNSDASLRLAITSAASGDTITFTSSITLAADLPAVQTNVTIIGNNNTLSGDNTYRGLFVGAFSGSSRWRSRSRSRISPSPTPWRRAATAGTGGGGAGLGGAIFIANLANVTVSNVSLTSNAGTGGSGGSTGTSNSGGGGGMGGNGGNGGAGQPQPTRSLPSRIERGSGLRLLHPNGDKEPEWAFLAQIPHTDWHGLQWVRFARPLQSARSRQDECPPPTRARRRASCWLSGASSVKV